MNAFNIFELFNLMNLWFIAFHLAVTIFLKSLFSFMADLQIFQLIAIVKTFSLRVHKLFPNMLFRKWLASVFLLEKIIKWIVFLIEKRLRPDGVGFIMRVCVVLFWHRNVESCFILYLILHIDLLRFIYLLKKFLILH